MQLKFVDYRFHLTWVHLNVNFVIWLHLLSGYICYLVISAVQFYPQSGYIRSPGYIRSQAILADGLHPQAAGLYSQRGYTCSAVIPVVRLYQ